MGPTVDKDHPVVTPARVAAGAPAWRDRLPIAYFDPAAEREARHTDAHAAITLVNGPGWYSRAMLSGCATAHGFRFEATGRMVTIGATVHVGHMPAVHATRTSAADTCRVTAARYA
jgi:hypothetical protein